MVPKKEEQKHGKRKQTKHQLSLNSEIFSVGGHSQQKLLRIGVGQNVHILYFNDLFKIISIF